MQTKQNGQNGFVSIITAMVIMIFVTLIALGFAFLARQNQEQNQNRLLSTQAFYAAESAVNDTVQFLRAQFARGEAPGDQTDCATSVNSRQPTIGSTNDEVKYTCVTYDTTPQSLEYTVTGQESKVIRLQSTTPIKDLIISWQNVDGNRRFADNDEHWLPQASFINDADNAEDGNNLATATGILRGTLIPITANFSSDNLTNKSQTFFMYPKAGNGIIGTRSFMYPDQATDPANQGTFIDGQCGNNAGVAPKHCNVAITDVDRARTNLFYLRLRSLYASSSVTIQGRDASNNPVNFMNEQAVVDATGKAVNVLRRIQVRVPLAADQSTIAPEFAIETVDDICKRLQVYPGGSRPLDITSPLNGVSGPPIGIPSACTAGL